SDGRTWDRIVLDRRCLGAASLKPSLFDGTIAAQSAAQKIAILFDSWTASPSQPNFHLSNLRPPAS
ncbi:MAG TPA: hypothetical protein VLZ56_06965, partial [Mycoplana sp.]|nr:hypothetical protein [Mycoplana sp.]